MSAVWVVRDATLNRQAVFLYEHPARHIADRNNGFTVTRETLLTPAQAAVIAAAKAQADAGKVHMDCECDQGQCDHFFLYTDAAQRTDVAVATLRAQEGE